MIAICKGSTFNEMPDAEVAGLTIPNQDVAMRARGKGKLSLD